MHIPRANFRFSVVVLLLFSLAAADCSSTQKTDAKDAVAVSANAEGSAAKSAVAGNDDPDQDIELPVYDPLEGYNRKIHSFNDFFFHYGLYPLASAWNFITPKFLRVGLDNFINWAYTPGRLINNLLQAKFKGAAKELVGFSINATVGGLGVYDAAKDMFDLRQSNEDSNQTLGKWGIPEGAYMVWPFIGPRTVRGTFGFVGDVALQPQMVIVPVYIRPETIWAQAAITAGTYTVRAVNNTSLDPDEYDNLMKDAIDPYNFIRDIYLQNTRKNVAD